MASKLEQSFQFLIDAIEYRLQIAINLAKNPMQNSQNIYNELDMVERVVVSIGSLSSLTIQQKQQMNKILQIVQDLRKKQIFNVQDFAQLSQIIQQVKNIKGLPTTIPPPTSTQVPGGPSPQVPGGPSPQVPGGPTSTQVPGGPSPQVPGGVRPPFLLYSEIPLPTYNEIQKDTSEVNGIVNDLNAIMNKIITNATITQSDKQDIANFTRRLQKINQKYPSADPTSDISKSLTDIIDNLNSMTGGANTFNGVQIGGNGQLISIINSLIYISNILLTRMNKLITTFPSLFPSPFPSPSVPPTDTTDYTKPLLALITYKIGSFNVYDQELIKYCENIGLNTDATLAIYIATTKNDIEKILYHYTKNNNYYFSSLMNILRLKKISAEIKFKKDYGIGSIEQMSMLLDKQSIW
jgi:hypothetical protein